MATGGLPSFPTFSVIEDSRSAPERWSKWLKRFETFTVAYGITNNKQRRALLLHVAGEEIADIFDGLVDTGNDTDYDTAVQRLNEHMVPKVNSDFETLIFRKAKQENGESMDSFHARLRKLATGCAFADMDREIKLQILQTCTSRSLKEKALLKPNLNLKQILEMARMMDLVQDQAAAIDKTESATDMVNAIAPRSKSPRTSYQGGQQNRNSATREVTGKGFWKSNQCLRQNYNKQCFNCAKEYPHLGGPGNCPAALVKCHTCLKTGHYARCCRSQRKDSNRDVQGNRDWGWRRDNRTVSTIQGDPRVSTTQGEKAQQEQDIFALVNVTSENKLREERNRLWITVSINGKDIEMLADTGAAVSVLQEREWHNLCPRPPLEKVVMPMKAYATTSHLPILGKFVANISCGNKETNTDMYVLKNSSEEGFSLLGFRACVDLNVVKILATTVDEGEKWEEKFPKVFKGIGKMKNFQVHLHLKEGTQPIIQPHRRIPYHLRELVDKEIGNLIQQDIIEQATGPTKWRTPLVVVQKKDDPTSVRICLDMRVPNQFIQRERHELPTIEDVTAKLAGAKYFSKIDLRKGYHQLELDEESRDITVFETHQGLYRFKRLFFGVNSASEVFQRAMMQNLVDIRDVADIIDDILVFGGTELEHDSTLEQTLKRLEDQNLTVNREKCEFKVKEVKFFGWIISAEGIKADPERIRAILEMGNPQSVAELRSFLGTTGYLLKFVPEYATIVEPLRRLVKKDAPWSWGLEQNQALQALKDCLTRTPVLKFFNTNLEVILWVDASPVGLGAVLLQKDKEGDQLRPITFASRSLNPTERKYAQIEREMLALAWGCKRHHMYLIGKSFIVYTDHQPLVHITKNKESCPSVRLERMLLKIQEYEYTVEYKPGKENIADYLSRHPVNGDFEDEKETKEMEAYAIAWTKDHTPKALTTAEIKQATSEDCVMSTFRTNIEAGKSTKIDETWSTTEQSVFKSLKRVEKWLTVVEDLLILGQKIVIPGKEEERVLVAAHQGHQGEEKMKKLLRTKVWFPKMSDKVKDHVKTCNACQRVERPCRKEPIQSTPLPNDAWTVVALDFCGPLRDGSYLLVFLDEYTRYPIVQQLWSTKAETTMQHVKKIFSLFGNPETVKTDNGQPFTSTLFEGMLSNLGIKHRKVTPYWPQANGAVERVNKPIKRVLQCAEANGTDWKAELGQWLNAYRATPHSTTNQVPFEMMFHRRIRNNLPMLEPFSKISEQEFQLKRDSMERKDAEKKAYMKHYADSKENHKSERTPLEEGDKVLLLQNKSRKELGNFGNTLWTVQDIKGTMITATNGNRTVTRNVSFFKPYKQPGRLIREPQEQRVLWSNWDFGDEDNTNEENLVNREDQVMRRPVINNAEREVRLRFPPRRLIQEMD